MYPDSWIYRGFTSCNFDHWWKQNGGQDTDLDKIHGFKLIFMHRRLLFGNSTTRFCNATSNFDKCHYIRYLRAGLGAKHAKTPLSLITRKKMEPDFGCWQSPDISRSHLYRDTIAWTPPTAIYWEYTVQTFMVAILKVYSPNTFQIKLSTPCEIALRWITQNTFDGKPTLFQIMSWCHQATSQYLSKFLPRSKLPYGITRPQWLKKKRQSR